MLRYALDIFKPFARLSIFSCCFLAIVALQSQQYKRENNISGFTNYVRQEKEQKKLVKFQKNTPGFGFDNLIADWTYLSFIQYFGDKSARDTIGYSLVPHYFTALRDRDPRFSKAYLTLSSANSVYAGRPKQTVNLMSEVLQSISTETDTDTDAAILWSYKGMDELLFLGDTDAAQKSYEMSVLFGKQYNSEAGDKLAEMNLETALFLADAPDTKEAQIAAWSMVLPHIKDYRHRQEIIDKIQRLEAELSALEAEEIEE